MDFFTNTDFFGSRTDRSFSSLKNFGVLSYRVQEHLKKVYQTLAISVFVASVGVYLHLQWGFGGLLTTLGAVALTVWLLSTPNTPSNNDKRVNLLHGAAFFHGASVGPLVELAIGFDSSILVTAFVGTACIFACFSAAAIFAKRREYLYLGGLLSSGLSLLFWIHTASFFFGGSTAAFTAELYLGLAIFMGYVIFDTQMIIERADRGDLDYVKHTLDLFVDFAGLFVRILVILLKNSSEKAEKERKKQRR